MENNPYFQMGRAYQAALDHLKAAGTHRIFGESSVYWLMEMDIARQFISIYRMWLLYTEETKGETK